ncbi:hypothetical protein MycrhN_3229 [Mycobacterium rhizamassiliense]|jgi:hypothetical protein|uniref:Uncharacterized protein n=1 Tax=Mycobacterium rhizamassiliense TaxID=1841860 RepID=A0A2U3NNM3_9MYCO|nr:hypothetical protein [Mycobacterium rhizamassiliense]SPM33101.1 hypothetical protein MycrhN_3229 [Mycobacterium rhizamassiliense]
MNQPTDPQWLRHPAVDLTGDAGGQIADFLSLAGDISFARDCAASYVRWERGDATAGGEQVDDMIKRALWTSCCIAYRRVFTSGKGYIPGKPRTRPTETFVAALNPEQLAAHEEVLDTANKHIAHRVSDLEQILVQVVLQPPPFPRDIATITTQLLHFMGPTIEMAETFIPVCDLLLAGTQQQEASFRQGVREDLQRDHLDAMYEAIAAQNAGENSSGE